jgi:ATP/maltotriose-dependent transcriptional regulator MalT
MAWERAGRSGPRAARHAALGITLKVGLDSAAEQGLQLGEHHLPSQAAKVGGAGRLWALAHLEVVGMLRHSFLLLARWGWSAVHQSRTCCALVAAPPPGHEPSLSLREHEVLGLIADGRTNRQVAETLYITDKTVGAHVTHFLSSSRWPIGARPPPSTTASA